MPVLAPGVAWVDLQFRGSPHVIATAILSGPGGAALVDPGPASCLDSLELGLNGMGIRFEDVTHILLTHVHLDHGGSTGTLLRRYPRLKVFVHERGAPHLVDPTRLVRSATRLWGDQMDALWGEVAPVPASNIVTLPSSTIDWSLHSGRDVAVEERSPDEVLKLTGRTADGELATVEIAAPGSTAANPGFDITPARLVTGFITERGVCAAGAEGLRSLFPEHQK